MPTSFTSPLDDAATQLAHWSPFRMRVPCKNQGFFVRIELSTGRLLKCAKTYNSDGFV